jgi:hypothetical protein
MPLLCTKTPGNNKGLAIESLDQWGQRACQNPAGYDGCLGRGRCGGGLDPSLVCALIWGGEAGGKGARRRSWGRPLELALRRRGGAAEAMGTRAGASSSKKVVPGWLHGRGSEWRRGTVATTLMASCGGVHA